MGSVEAGDALPLLQAIQNEYGYLPEKIVRRAARETGIPESRLFGVATFYAQFHIKPHGRHTVRVCRGTACYVRGAGRILDAVKKNLGIEDGETTADMLFSLETVACLGSCAISPVLMVDDTYFSRMNPQSVALVLDRCREEAKE